MNKIEILNDIINNANNIVLLTGAGISVPSGIPDFRSANGIYHQNSNTNLKPEEIISHSFFKKNPKYFYEFYKNKMIYLNAKPNIAHYYFSELEKCGKLKAIITQNIDDLHQKAGSKEVYELHGAVYRNYCLECHKYFDVHKIISSEIPFCDCGGLIKPDVVLYEEPLDDELLIKAITAINNADVLIVVGTSLVVYPAAGLLKFFKGKHLVLINKTTTDFDNKATLVLNDDIINVIKELKGEQKWT